MLSVKTKIETFLGKDERSKNANRNSVVIFVCKGLTSLIGFFLLPLTVGYVDSATYGIWLTISSMASWLSVFDIGMGNGLKNRFVECKAQNDDKLAQKYVSTTYAMLTFIFIPLLIIFLFLNPFIDWNKILNIETEENLHTIFAIVFGYFSINFILSTINTVLIADQRPGESSVRTVIQQIAILITIIILRKITDGSLLNLCMALCVVPITILIIFNVILFSGRYRSIRPKLKSVDFHLLRGLLSLSLKFFFLQSVALILFQLTNFIIIHYYSASEVTIYNVAYKYFSLPTAFFAAIVTPLWVAVADAINKSDFYWIRKSLKRYSLILFLFVFVELLMLCIANPFYHLWMQSTIEKIPFQISLLCMTNAIITMSANVYVHALCGAGYLRLQMIFCIFSPVSFVLLCFLFIKMMHLGVWCILLASIISNIYGAIIAPAQCYLVFFKNKKGILVK